MERRWLITTRPCPDCGKVSDVELSDEEYVAVKNATMEGSDVKLNELLPNRNQAERYLIATGWHDKCWQQRIKRLTKNRDGNSLFRK